MLFRKRPPRGMRSEVVTKESETTAGDSGSTIIRTPPIKPFVRAATPTGDVPRRVGSSRAAARLAPAAPPSAMLAPTTAAPAPASAAASAAASSPAHRAAEIIARHAPRPAAPAARPIPGQTLVVGRDIRLTGEIRACQRLIVEGSVEAELTDTRTLEIAESGRFRGSAAVGECVVSGSFDGDLTVSGLLAVRASGRVGGAIRYAEIEVERGGRITGRADLQGPQEVRAVVRAAPEPRREDPTAAPTGAGPRPA